MGTSGSGFQIARHFFQKFFEKLKYKNRIFSHFFKELRIPQWDIFQKFWKNWKTKMLFFTSFLKNSKYWDKLFWKQFEKVKILKHFFEKLNLPQQDFLQNFWKIQNIQKGFFTKFKKACCSILNFLIILNINFVERNLLWCFQFSIFLTSLVWYFQVLTILQKVLLRYLWFCSKNRTLLCRKNWF